MSLVPVARRGRLFGFGIETQALEDAVGLSSEMGRRRSGSGLFGCAAISLEVEIEIELEVFNGSGDDDAG